MKRQENKLKFTDNKPLIGALVTGIFYFLFIIGTFALQSKEFFVIFFLPGITFPIVTSYFNTRHLKNRVASICGHFVCSVLLYVVCVSVFLSEMEGASVVLAGLIGSLVYLTTSINLYKGINEKIFSMGVILSGIVFIPVMLSNKPVLSFLGKSSAVYSLAFGVFAWTLINGYVLNHSYKKSITH